MDFSLPYPDAMFADSPSMALDDDLDLFDAFGYPGLTGSADLDILDPVMGPLETRGAARQITGVGCFSCSVCGSRVPIAELPKHAASHR